ncbi:hypothetical protein ZWY2020_048108 [Hordeum vulgare]|nr:hypothetical protein ZWY2020_048108 [Hordeum vulgare]
MPRFLPLPLLCTPLRLAATMPGSAVAPRAAASPASVAPRLAAPSLHRPATKPDLVSHHRAVQAAAKLAVPSVPPRSSPRPLHLAGSSPPPVAPRPSSPYTGAQAPTRPLLSGLKLPRVAAFVSSQINRPWADVIGRECCRSTSGEATCIRERLLVTNCWSDSPLAPNLWQTLPSRRQLRICPVSRRPRPRRASSEVLPRRYSCSRAETQGEGGEDEEEPMRMKSRGGGWGAAGGEDEDDVGRGGLEVAAQGDLRGGGARVRGDCGHCWAVERG